MRKLPCMILASICMSTFLSADARADKILDFSDPAITWPAGSLMQTYTDVDGSGVDIKVSISGSTADFDTGFPALDMSGGTAPDDQKALWFRMDSHSNLGQAITALVEFFETGTTNPAAVTDVSAVLLEIDYVDEGINMYRDDIRDISATLAGSGDPVAGTAMALTGGTPSFEIVDDGLLPMRLTGTTHSPQSPTPGADTGDATVDFGSSTVTSFEFSYGNRLPLSATDPTLQFTALQSVHFLLVPEPSSIVLGLTGFSCLAFLVLRRVRQKKKIAC